MQYFTHTLKACGPIALALALSACGEETAVADALGSSETSSERLTELATEVVQEQSQALEAAAATQPVTVARGSTPGAPVQGSIDRDALVDTSPVAPVTPVALDAPVAPIANAPTTNIEDNPVETALGADPRVTLVADTSGGLNTSGTILQWSAQNVDSCEASGAWEGQVGVSGARDLNHDAAGELTYTISCRGASGTAVAMVTITVESAALAWQPPEQNTNGSAITDLAGYNLYYGTESGAYTQMRPVRDPSQTALELPVESGTYYLAMTAYDLSGNESELSNEVVRIVN